VITIHQRHRRTDGQTTCDRNTALCTKVHRAVKMFVKIKYYEDLRNIMVLNHVILKKDFVKWLVEDL